VKNKALEYLLVAIQFVTIAYLVLYTSWKDLPFWAYILTAAAGFLACWAIIAIHPRQLRVTPEPAEQARLITHGPYRVIRHPMYTSLILLAGLLVIAEYSHTRLVVAAIMVLDLWIKMKVEERLLQDKFPAYKAYMQKSWRVIPYIY